MIDASIYQNIKPMQGPDVADSMGKMMTLRGLQQQEQMNQMKMSEAQQAAKVESAKRIQQIALPVMETLVKLPEQERASAFPSLMKDLEAQGMPMNNVPKDPVTGQYVYDPKFVSSTYNTLLNSDYGIARQEKALGMEETRAKIAKLNAEAKGGGSIDPYKAFLIEGAKDKSVERLAGNLGTSQDAARTIKNVEQLIGFDLNKYDPSKNTVDGKKVDLPGVSIPALGRFTAYSSDARVLDNTASKLFNIELKDRSGAAVTTPELERLKMEYSQGKFNTESEILGAMKRYKSALLSKMRDIEAANPSAASRYASQGGTTSGYLQDGVATKEKQAAGSVNASETNFRKVGTKISKDEVMQYATKYGMTAEAAKSYLKGQGYDAD